MPVELKHALDLLDRTIGQAWKQRPILRVDLQGAAGSILASPVFAIQDHPPFHQSLRDGVAIHSASQMLQRELVGKVLAGESGGENVGLDQAIRIMTGAPVPEGCDAVVMIEDVQWWNQGQELNPAGQTLGWSAAANATHVQPTVPVQAGQFIMPRGSIYTAGSCLAQTGRWLDPALIGLLASNGVEQVDVMARPKVSILITGDEVVAAGNPLLPGQIFNSNGPLLASLASVLSVSVLRCDHIGDQSQALRCWLQMAMEDSDLIITTGSVSAGEKDLLPGLFQSLDVQQVFHGVKMKPGKPVWFGQFARDAKLGFLLGLPGNPVSCQVGFRVFVERAIRILNAQKAAWTLRPVELAEDFRVSGQRLTFWPGQIASGDYWIQKLPSVTPLPWKGSPDLATLRDADGWLVLDPTTVKEGRFPKGAQVWVLEN